MFSTVALIYNVFLPFGLLMDIQVHASGEYFMRLQMLNFLLTLIRVMQSKAGCWHFDHVTKHTAPLNQQ